LPLARRERCLADLYVCPADNEIRLEKTRKRGTP